MSRRLSGCLTLFCAFGISSFAFGDEGSFPKLTMDGTAVPFQSHDGYHVSNKFEPNAPESFVVIRDQERFDQVFGVARVMGKDANLLEADAFESRLVLAVIKRGNAPWSYQVNGVSQQDGIVTALYTPTPGKTGGAKFASPLIISIPKGDYRSVLLAELRIKTIQLSGE